MKITDEQYSDAIQTIKRYFEQDPLSIYSDDFVEWRKKYFNVSIRPQSHQSKKSGRRYTNSELFKKFKKSRGLI